MKIHSLFIITFLLFCNITKCGESAIAVSAVGYGITLALDVCSILSEKMRYGLYGDTLLPEKTEQELRSMIAHFNVLQPTNIRQSQWPWDTIAGNIFSNYDTLFVSKKICDQKSFIKNFDYGTKKELVTSMLMIEAQYDQKLIALSIITPIVVWIVAKTFRFVSKKANSFMPLDYATHLVRKLSKKFDKSFKAKSFTSLCILGAYILYQRYSFNTQAQALIK